MEGGSTRALTTVYTILTVTRAGETRPVRVMTVMTPSGATGATRAIAAARVRSFRIGRIWIKARIAGKVIAGKPIAGRGIETRQPKRHGRDPSRSGVAAPAIALAVSGTTIEAPLLGSAGHYLPLPSIFSPPGPRSMRTPSGRPDSPARRRRPPARR